MQSMRGIWISPMETSTSALKHDKGRALDPKKMLAYFFASNPMQSIEA